MELNNIKRLSPKKRLLLIISTLGLLGVSGYIKYHFEPCTFEYYTKYIDKVKYLDIVYTCSTKDSIVETHAMIVPANTTAINEVENKCKERCDLLLESLEN